MPILTKGVCCLESNNRNKAVQERFTQIYNEYKSPIYKLCLVKLKDKDSAEDCMQNTFMVLYKKMLNKEEIENPRAFLYKTSGNFILKCFEEKKKNVNQTVCISDYENKIVDNQNAIDSDIDYQLLNKRLNSLLTQEEQLLLRYKYIYDFTIEETAKRLNISAPAAAKRLQRLREKIKKSVSIDG